MMKNHWLEAIVVALIAGLVLPSVADAKRVRSPVPLETAREEIPEELLLDVGIELFDTGLPTQDPAKLFELEEEGIYEDVRKAEARFVAIHLMETLQSTGFWGAVRVLPAASSEVDLKIGGRIVSSSGLELEVDIWASDATGKRWLERDYREEADLSYYREDLQREPFQSLYHATANDLRKKLDRFEAQERLEIRQTTRMRFAGDLAPDAFGDYIERDRRGRVEVARLPAENDSMMARVEMIRSRDELFVDTLTAHYSAFSAGMVEPYFQWRRYSFEEETARKKLKRQARTRQILGALAIIGAVAAGGDDDSGVIRDLAIIGGIEAFRSGSAKYQESKLHRESLRELASSFDAEVAPLLVDVEGETLRLTGSVEAQYAEWRELLRRMLAEETGRPLDPDGDGILELPDRTAPAAPDALQSPQ